MMAKQKRATATVKMTYTDDADLIAWWNSVPRGSRNAVMKDIMRDYIARERGGYRPILPRNVPQPFDPTRFTKICDDTAWIRSALLELPTYIEQVIHHVVAAVPHERVSTTDYNASDGEVSDAAAQRREQRMKKARW